MRKLLLVFLSVLTFNVTAQVTMSVNVSTAGGIFNYFTETERTYVSNLTITGKINASDFRILRDYFPAIEILDLSNVLIVEYTGINGTNGTSNHTYPSNSIPDKAFYFTSTGLGKTTLKSITFPSNLESIGYGAFWGCTQLANVTLTNHLTTISDYAFAGCRSINTITLPNSITSIGNGFMSNCSNLSQINIPSSIISIGEFAFMGCLALVNINLPNSINSIGQYAFFGCNHLANVILPSSVTSVGIGAFKDCIALTSINIPSSVTLLGDRAFYNCKGLMSINVNNTTPLPLASQDVFFNVDKNSCILYVPVGKVSVYRAANIWNDFVEINDNFTTSKYNTSDQDIKIYPNPTIDYLVVSDLLEGGAVSIIDISGKIMLKQQLKNNDKISISSFPKGIYSLIISSSEGTVEKKIIKL